MINMETSGESRAVSTKVLVVDDDPLQQGEITEFLTRRGIDVIVADNGFAAFHEIKNTRPAVVVMDMKMPGKKNESKKLILKVNPLKDGR